MDATFYNSEGHPVFYTKDGETLYHFDGTPLAYFHNDSIYSFGGKHLGRLANGLIRDNDGDVAFFTQGSHGGPVKPIRQIKPIKSIKSIKPIKNIREIRPVKPVNSLNWSEHSDESFFAEN